MEIWVVISPDALGAAPLANLLAAERRSLPASRALYPRAPGKTNHTRLALAMLDPDHQTLLRRARGLEAEGGPATMRGVLSAEFGREVRSTQPEKLVLVAEQLATSLIRHSELEQLRSFLSNYSTDIRLILHVDEPGATLARHYAAAITHGRTQGLDQELALAATGEWFDPARAALEAGTAASENRAETDAPPFWLEYMRLIRFWEEVFGLGTVHLADGSTPRRAVESALQLIGLDLDASRVPEAWPDPPGDVWLVRNRAINALFRRMEDAGVPVDRRALINAHGFAEVPGDPVAPAALAPVTRLLLTDRAELLARAPGLKSVLTPPRARKDWQDPGTGEGFRAVQCVGAVMPKLDARNAAADKARAAAEARVAEGDAPEGDIPPAVAQIARKLASGPYAPNNTIAAGSHDPSLGPFPVKPAKVKKGERVLALTAMKNEGPFILEWIAYHRAIGITDFLVYTNDCDDGTDKVLDVLESHGILTHRLNNEWRGKSPQQAALNKSLKEPQVKKADWIVHFDVDEFINVRAGRGRIQDLFATVPGATAFTLTWRTFGHNGVIDYDDKPIIGQFTAASPSYCPKPHTAWGFKTLFRNIGAYEKFSCHRPNKLRAEKAEEMRWVNGSGLPLPESLREKGWRSDTNTIGYDLVQLNHYPLRSAESFLVKRERGRALHVDRAIGRNYWIRNDWNDFLDDSIQRNLPRLEAEMTALLALPGVRNAHDNAVARHREKIAELRSRAEFAELLDTTTSIKLSALDRAAYSLMLDIADREG